MSPTIHPGEFLAEILDELSLSQAEFARRIGVSAMRISHVIKGSRPVTAELACRFGKAFGQTPQYWLNLQTGFELKNVDSRLAQQLERIERLAT
jgi:addiction module HigA family antidote